MAWGQLVVHISGDEDFLCREKGRKGSLTASIDSLVIVQ
jgi:hypothetical protein